MRISEKRLDWAICWPPRNECEPFRGAVRLSIIGGEYRVGLHCALGAPIGLSITQKDGLKESFSCPLEWCSFGRWQGRLPFDHNTFEVRVASTTAPNTGQRIYRVYFDPRPL